MSKEHVENLAALEVTPIPWDPAGLASGARLRPLARDPGSGGFTGLVDLPAGFDSGSGLSCAVEMRLFVIDGELRMGENRLGPGGFCYHPAGSAQGRWRSAEGARAFVVFLEGPEFEAADGAPAPGAVPALDSFAMDWHNPLDASDPSQDFRPGIFVKVLHVDPETRASTHLAGLMPGWYAEGMETHPVYEENYCLQGDVLIGEVGDETGYTMVVGSYMCRPAGVIHGPLASKNGNVNLCFTHGLLGIDYSENPRSMGLIRKHLRNHPGPDRPAVLVNLERARAKMEEAGLEAMVCVQPINVYYASGYESDWLFDYQWAGCAILPLSEDRPATLIVHDVELTNLAEHPSWMPELRVYETQVGDDLFCHYTVDEDAELEESDRKTLALMDATRATASVGVVEAILKALCEGGYRRLGFDDARLTSLCAERLSGVQCFDRPELMTMIRAVKTPAELELMREAGRRNQQALSAAIDAAGVGVKWSDIRRTWHLSVAEQDCMPWCIYVGAGHKSMGLWHDHDYPIREGDQLCFDSMLTWQRYFGDMQRTCVMGAPSAKLKRYWNAAYAAAEAVYEAMRPGMNTVDLRKLALEVGTRGGIKGFRHAFMHGLGLEHLELPSASPGLSGFDLEEGMVVNMDMEVCEIGFGGIYYENTLLIGRDGPEYLCDMPRELIHLPC